MKDGPFSQISLGRMHATTKTTQMRTEHDKDVNGEWR